MIANVYDASKNVANCLHMTVGNIVLLKVATFQLIHINTSYCISATVFLLVQYHWKLQKPEIFKSYTHCYQL